MSGKKSSFVKSYSQPLSSLAVLNTRPSSVESRPSPAAGMPTDNPLARMWGKLTAPEPPPDGTDYERERDERIA